MRAIDDLSDAFLQCHRSHEFVFSAGEDGFNGRYKYRESRSIEIVFEYCPRCTYTKRTAMNRLTGEQLTVTRHPPEGYRLIGSGAKPYQIRKALLKRKLHLL
jgi:hypothetical protein